MNGILQKKQQASKKNSSILCKEMNSEGNALQNRFVRMHTSLISDVQVLGLIERERKGNVHTAKV